ncbi:copper resistance CopC family protein (plasmid) [Coraliomargarita sp. W4R53]
MSTSVKSAKVLPRNAFAIAAAVLLVAASVFFASPAQAHDELLGNEPAADATLEALPEAITLTFSGLISQEDGATEVQVMDDTGASLATADPEIEDNVLTQPVEGDPAGLVTVLWKVVSSDGHPISGEYSFTVTAPAPTETTEPTATATTEPVPTQEPTAAPSASPSASTPAETDSDNTALPWIIGGVIALGVIAAVIYLIASRSRQKKARADADPTIDSDPTSKR